VLGAPADQQALTREQFLDVRTIAAAYDPEAFEDHPIEDRSRVAWIQWAARRKVAVEAAERLVRSGVVAADQRTADRETIAQAVFAAPALIQWRRSDAYAVADAVLAVLVPADQIRAETLEAWAGTVRAEAEADERALTDILDGELPQDSRIMLNGVTRAAERAVKRAAEYRKKAGA
jgi:hypothetical protein